MICKGIVKTIVFALICIGVNFAFAQSPVFTYPAGPHNYTTGTTIVPLSPTNKSGPIPPNIYSQVTTFAGDGTHNLADGVGTKAATPSPVGIAIDASNNLYVTGWYLDGIPYLENTIRQITPAAVVTTLAGNAGGMGKQNGTGAAASFFSPDGVAVDANGNVFVADVGNNLIRKITPGGVVSTYAGNGTSASVDGLGILASFSGPNAIAIDKAGNLYVSDYTSSKIRKIDPTGLVTTLAGGGNNYGVDGVGVAASFHNPQQLVVDGAGNVYVADAGDNDIRKITPAGVVTTFAGSTAAGDADGKGSAAAFNRPSGLCMDIGGNLYVADTYNNTIRRISPAGDVTTIAGSAAVGATDGVGSAATFFRPQGLGIDANGNLYVGDTNNNLIRKVQVTGYTISPSLPPGLYFDGTSGIISGRPTAPSPSFTTTYTITGYNIYGSTSATVDITVTGPVNAPVVPPLISYQTPQVYKVNLAISPLAPTNTGGAVPATLFGNAPIFAGSGQPGAVNNTGQQAQFTSPDGVAVDITNDIFVADAGNNLIRKITPTGIVTTFAGTGAVGQTNGQATNATFNRITGIAVDLNGDVFVSEAGNNDVREIKDGGQVVTFATGFNSPAGLVVDGNGNVYVADLGNNLIKEISSSGLVTVFAGSGNVGSTDGVGTAASFSQPSGLSFDAAGNLYVADSGNNLIRRITPGGLVSTFAGSGQAGSADGTGASASFKSPAYLTVDAIGNVYVSDSGNDLIRKITPAGVVSTLAGSAGQPGRSSGQGTAAKFNDPRGIVVDPNGNLFIGDLTNNIIREVFTTGYTIDKTLPPGLTFDGTTGVISGTPTAASPATVYTIIAYNAGGTCTTTITITVKAPAIVQSPPPNISYVTPQNYIINGGIIPLSPANTGGEVPATIYGQVSTLAGSGSSGNTNGTGTAASFSGLHAVATDLVGNVYYADNNIIKEISPSGVVSTLAGSGAAGSADGNGTAASFNQPDGIAVDADGTVYVADTKNNTIRKITQAGVVATIAGKVGVSGVFNANGTAATFNSPKGITVDQNGNIFIADASNNVIREISPTGDVTTYAGTGAAGAVNGSANGASFNNPVGVTADLNGNLFVADNGNNLIREISTAGAVTTFAGNGTQGNANGQALSASFNNILSVSADIAGNVYIADAGNNVIRKVTPGQNVTTLAGSGSVGATNGALAVASFNNPVSVAGDIFGNVYVADLNNNLARKIVTTGFIIDKALPPGLTFDGTTGTISGTPTALSPTTKYTVTAYNTGGSSATIITITVGDKPVPPVPAPSISYTTPNVYQVNTTITPLIPTNTGGAFPNAIFGKTTTLAGSATAGDANGQGTAATFNQPFGIATDNQGNIYVADHLNNQIRKITPGGAVTVFAGSGAFGSADGPAATATFNSPTGVAVDGAGNVYVADVSNNLIRKITPGGVVTTLAGNIKGGRADGIGTGALFSNPSGIAVDGGGNIYVADLSNNQIRKITPGGVVTTLAGTGLSGSTDGLGNQASFTQPYGVAVDATGNVYVADWGNNLIRKITPDGVVSTLAGSGAAGAADGLGTAASFDKPFGITIDEDGNIYVADTDNELIRKITPDGNVTTVAGNGQRGNTDGVQNTSSFYQPTGIVADGSGDVFVTDEFNNTIRQIVVVSNFTIDKPLPPGLTFNNTTGEISGKATGPSPATTYTVTAYNLGGSSSFPVVITIDASVQTITFSPIAPKTYGDPDFDPGASSNNTTIPIVYTTNNPSVAIVDPNGELKIIGAGSFTVTATQAGNGSFMPAMPVTQTITIAPAALTVTADDKSMPYGTTVPKLTFSYSGFVYQDKPSSLTKQPIALTTAEKDSPIGTYPITLSGGVSTNYTFTYADATLTINPAPALIAIPNTFTPNGDGINDVWHIDALAYFPNCLVSIYSRYGSLVYQSRGYQQPWDGTINGKQLPVGTYYYIINPEADSKPLSGSLTIIR